jgi:hypothetical protein
MSEILNRIDTLTIKWKDFIFDMCIKDFSMKEDAKVVTYEYA